MDGKRFDELSRLLSRHSTLKGALAAVFANGAPHATAAPSAAAVERRTSIPRRTRNRCDCPDGQVSCGSA